MDSPKLEIIGVYRIPFTEELYKKAYEVKYSGYSIPFWRKGKIKKTLKEELSSIALIEIIVKKPDNKFNMGDFGQPNSDQAPYDEAFLNPEGTQIISRGFDVPNSDEIRILFFLHFFDPEQPLKTSYGQLTCPKIKEIPDRLKQIIDYEPID